MKLQVGMVVQKVQVDKLSTGAYEPSKVAKEHATAVYTRVPSKYKFEQQQFPY